jgi:DNA-directed RNA polymerase sigma subunit (sigma70/sigma32)
VIRARFGLDGDPAPQSYATIATRLGRSVRAVRTIEQQALRDLGRIRELQGLADCA